MPVVPARRLSPPTLDVVVEQARRDLVLPESVRQLLAEEGTAAPGAVEELAARLRDDPGLLEPVRRWGSTRFFADRKTTGSLEATAASLGPNLTRRLVTLAALQRHFLPDRAIGPYSRGGLWSHGMTVGVLSDLIARLCGMGDPAMAFFAGTLHDIGLLALERVAPGHFAALLARVDPLAATDDAEREEAGWDHAQLAAVLLDGWGFPVEVVDAARYHHTPEECDTPSAPLVAVVSLANYLTSRMGRPALGVHNVAPVSDAVFKALGIDARLLHSAVQATQHALQSAGELV